MIQAIKGMKDLIETQAQIYQHIINTASQIAQNFGYSYINLPHLEFTPLFRRSVGESSDIVGKEMYEFIDKGGSSVCLRPEGTAGVVRMFIEKKLDKANAIKRYFYHGSMFRYERPQKGRLREFHQFGVECFNIKSVYEDAAIIIMLSKIFDKLGIKTKLKINSLGDLESMKEYKLKLVNFIEQNSGFCQDCLRRKELNPIRVLDCKNTQCKELLQNAPSIIDSLNDECKDDFDKLQQILQQNNVEFEVDTKLVRGLDYYCKSAFEFISDEIGSQSAIAGGGRYDKLVEYLDGKPTYGVGFAMGIERIMDILSKNKTSNLRDGVYLCPLEPNLVDKVFQISNILRDKFVVNVNYEAKNLQKHLKIADNQNSKFFMCIGEDEISSNKIWLKNLDSKAERYISFDDLQHLEL